MLPCLACIPELDAEEDGTPRHGKYAANRVKKKSAGRLLYVGAYTRSNYNCYWGCLHESYGIDAWEWDGHTSHAQFIT